MSIARGDALDFYRNLDLHWYPEAELDTPTNEWRVTFRLRVPARGGEPFYRINGVTGAIIERAFSR